MRGVRRKFDAGTCQSLDPFDGVNGRSKTRECARGADVKRASLKVTQVGNHAGTIQEVREWFLRSPWRGGPITKPAFALVLAVAISRRTERFLPTRNVNCTESYLLRRSQSVATGWA